MSLLYPDSIVNKALTELAYEGSQGVSFDKLWELLTPILQIDGFYQKVIYAWLIKNSNVEILNAEEKVIDAPKNYDDIAQGKYFIRVTSDYQCLVLTGLPKENNPIIGRAYDLLVEIAKSRKEGIDTLTLTQKTGQDKRSLTTRIKNLGNLVVKVPILKNGRNLSLLTLTKFFDNAAYNKNPIKSEKEEKFIINVEDIRLRIINALKNAKHNIRQTADLKRELEMDKSSKLSRNFKSITTYLEEKQFLEKVFVVSPKPPKRQFLALKYLKDYIPKNQRDQNDNDDLDDDDDIPDDDDEEQELNEDLIDDNLKDLENEAPTSLTNVENIEITSSKNSKNYTIFNRIFPLQNQIFQLVNNSGTSGLSTNDLLDTVLGRSYDRLFTKVMECYTPENLIPNIANHSIVRHYDFQGKVKFYRYLTRPNFLKFSGQDQDLNGSTLLTYEPTNTSLKELNKKHFTTLNSGVSVVTTLDGHKYLQWFGSQVIEGSTPSKSKKKKTTKKDANDNTKKKRGRPRKGEEDSNKNKQLKVSNIESQTSNIDEIPFIGEPSITPQISSTRTSIPHQDQEPEKEPQPETQDDISSSIDPQLANPTDIPVADSTTTTENPEPSTSDTPTTTEKSSSKDKRKTKFNEAGKFKHSKEKLITVSDLKVTSFKALERMNTIMKVLKDNNGVMENSIIFSEAVNKEANQQIDRKTFKKDVNSLIEQNKIYIGEFFIGREQQNHSVIILKGTTNEDLNKAEHIMKENLKSSGKPLAKKSTLENIDLEFYDDDFKKSFETELPPTKRMRAMERRAQRVKELAQNEEEKNEVNENNDNDINDHAKAIEKAYREAQTSNTLTYVDESSSFPFPTSAPIQAPVQAQFQAPNTGLTRKSTKAAPKPKKKSTPKKQAVKSKPIVAKAPRVRKEKKTTEWDTPKPKEQRGQSYRNKRNTSNLNSADTMLLFKAVIICKTITKNIIDWEKITKLFNGIPEEILKKKWPRIRMMMGQNGGKVARRTWKRILLSAVKEGRISLEEVENLNLENLVKIWQDSEILGLSDDLSDSLFANYEDNISHYNFVKSSISTNSYLYDPNSMVQREQYLVSRSFTYENNDEKDFAQAVDHVVNNDDGFEEDNVNNRSIIRKTIIAIILSGTNTNIRKLPLLESFDKQLVDEVFMEMTRKKEISINLDTKVSIGETLNNILNSNTYDFSITKVNQIQNLLNEVFEAKKAFVLNPIFDNAYMVPIIELLSRNQLDILRVDHYRKEVLEGYEARVIEREKLDCDIILAPGSEKIQNVSNESPLVPMGKPCSYIWIDVEGKINKNVWNKINRLVLITILGKPGITKFDLLEKLSLVLNKEELIKILEWLVDAKAIKEGEFQGVWLNPFWYTIFGTS
ncbi:Transcription factor tau subunit [Wickerhamomyces ciferrii]|uniref:Transcription factor tau subunit n=1 Tax=Wickerhamomyces ciferrii (strain ATCC 14091 / BCRC 22168 / CBS 111 / JCM 3599 / NBRC 0793 / NRRL Y-1031 F-60-10) TaxID=1206466 RepID=K0KN60_WICCF|nr:Transcription factor tau subunit [Wickerhamomyces ciferrii]CCH46700.1 Transcription factor tau subunit [Wickerhamomyces ciferrii]